MIVDTAGFLYLYYKVIHQPLAAILSAANGYFYMPMDAVTNSNDETVYESMYIKEKKNAHNPIDLIRDELKKSWGDIPMLKGTFPVLLRVARIEKREI